MGYVYLLKRLAHVCYTNRKFADAEKYFKVVLKVMPTVSTNPMNLYSAHKNLLLLYTYTDLDKAIEYGQGLKAAEKEFLPIHVKDLSFMVANIHFLRGDYGQAKTAYRSTLQTSPSDEVKY
jgi:tetratricopeptide (TPR) repeat protein